MLSQINPFRSKAANAEQERIVQGLKNTFLYLLGMAGRQLKKKLIDEQEIVLNLSTILQEAYLCESALLKVKKLAKSVDIHEEELNLKQQMLQLYLYEALERARKAALEAIASFATKRQKPIYNRVVKWMLKPYDINPKQWRRNIARTLIQKGCYE